VLGKGLLFAGIGLFSLTVLFQLINLPVEFDASNRAKAQLIEAGIVTPDEMLPIRSVLSAAAMTYVAATITAVLTLIYFVLRASQSRQ
jgi:Zn-dependent membrane protease YugP